MSRENRKTNVEEDVFVALEREEKDRPALLLSLFNEAITLTRQKNERKSAFCKRRLGLLHDLSKALKAAGFIKQLVAGKDSASEPYEIVARTQLSQLWNESYLKLLIEACGRVIRKRNAKMETETETELRRALFRIRNQLLTPSTPSPSSEAEKPTGATDSSEDTQKKERISSPRKLAEFNRCAKAVKKLEASGMTRQDATANFVHKTEQDPEKQLKERNRLLKLFSRHPAYFNQA